MKRCARAVVILLVSAFVNPCFGADARDEKPGADKADLTKKDDAAKKDDPVKKDDPAKKDDKDAKAAPAKKDAKADDAKKDAKPDDAGKKDDAKKENTKKKDEHLNTEKTIKAGQITGKIVSVEVTKRSLRLSIALTVPTLDSSAVNSAATNRMGAQQNLVLAQQALAQYRQLSSQAAQATNQAQQSLSKKDKNGYTQNMSQASQYQSQAAQYQSQAAQYQLAATQQNILAARTESNPYRNDTKYKEIELATTDDVKVRLSNPPEVYDDRGKRRRWTSKELKEAKGDDPKLPGYQGDFIDLREQQIITATLVKSKDAPKQKPAAKKDADAVPLGDNLPQASMILIVADPAPSK
jgi:hypothetical protein